MQANNRLWALGAGIIVIAVVAMGWFLGISPKLDVAAANNSQRLNVEMQNTVQERNLAKIKSEYEQIDTLKTDLASLRHALPATDDLSTFIGELHTLEQSSKVTITSITSSDGQPYIAAVSADPPATDAPADADTRTAATVSTGAAAATTDTGSDAAVPDLGKGLVTPENFVAIPINLNVTGSRDQVMNFVDALQNGTRLYLVTTLTVAEDADNTAEDITGDAKKAAANYTGTISGFVYVLLDADNTPAAPATDAPVAAAAP